MSIRRAKQEQEEIIQIAELWGSFKPIEEKIKKKKKDKTQGKKIFTAQKSVLNNADNLYRKREKIVSAFRSEEIIPRDLKADVFDKSEDSEPEPSFEENQKEQKREDEKNLMHKIKKDRTKNTDTK